MELSIDREKVIKGLLFCFAVTYCDGCPYEVESRKITRETPEDHCPILDDALALLKEQEPVEPTINEDGKAYCICGENVGIIPRNKNLPSIRSKYCSECGRRMKWKYD